MRGYRFDQNKFEAVENVTSIEVTQGQVAYERQHLLKKLTVRDRARWESLSQEGECAVHPLFAVVAGDREEWERV